jgi:hypothetical protein
MGHLRLLPPPPDSDLARLTETSDRIRKALKDWETRSYEPEPAEWVDHPSYTLAEVPSVDLLTLALWYSARLALSDSAELQAEWSLLLARVREELECRLTGDSLNFASRMAAKLATDRPRPHRLRPETPDAS